ncbi:biotin-dependent carboxyltransferase family protein [Maribacter sp. 2304DJ31-5]|uniref:5-oxoprolinase subunit C family protein n=1 Tax=Maribacter sp. 2304DJ31-5 TaxID=3386273 RepID=UPI0039BD81D1
MLKVIKSGFYLTVQDLGRFYSRNKGVPVSGAMDTLSLLRANALLENQDTDAVLEIAMMGPTLLFKESTYISLAGAEMTVTLNDKGIQNNTAYKINAGDIVSYGRLEKGFRGYLAIKGGFQTKSVLDSKSFYTPITDENRLKNGDLVPYNRTTVFMPKISEIKTGSLLEESILTVYRAPEYGHLTDKQLESIFAKEFTIAKENDRMAYQLKETIQGHDISMLTSATLPGTVQLTPSGKLIMLMKDGQTTGGYPRILQLTNEAICILAQKKSGDIVSFKLM